MAEKRRGLGRGLGSLIPSQETGRPSDVFFPRGEREEPDDAADAPIAQKKSSDPAESMRRAQAGRRNGAAKRAPAKASSSKTDDASSRAAEDSVETESAAPSAKKPAASSRKSTTSSTRAASRSTETGDLDTPTGTSSAVNTKTRQTAPKSREDSSRSSEESKETAPAADPASTTTAEEPVSREASGGESAAESVREDSSGNGVYVSHETVRSQKTSEDAVDDTESVTGTHVDLEEIDSGAEPVRSTDGNDRTAETTEASAGEVPRETGDAADDAADDLVPVPGTTFGEIPLDRIRPNPRQPRGVFDEDALDELITSIREIGVLQPVVVRRRPDAPGQYELIMGERRYRASKEAGRETIPAIVRETKSDELLRDALLENLHRVDLNPLEEAAAYAQLLEDFSCTQEELSERIGRSRPQISNTIRLLKLPAMVQRRVAAGVLSSGHARALLGLNDGANMEVLAQRVVAEGLSVRATEESVILLNRGDRSAVSRGTREPDPELADLARSLGDRLDTRVNVVMGKRKGKLSVEFANGEDLTRILTLLGLDEQKTDDASD